ncbi:hypothetical protein [Granulicoccus sp. GXG6511]|uniref:hypothetical protein n=1 Tax=Granulicoccus sp. GXG6511 TaxID=3381351 RepID=UPI003D7E1D53
MVDGALMLTMMAVSAVLVVIVLFGGRQPRRRPVSGPGRAPTFAPDDLSELSTRFKVVDEEHRRNRLKKSEELHRRLDMLVAGRAPVRRVAPAPDSSDANRAHIHFADGTTLRVRVNLDQLEPLIEAVNRSTVWLSSYRTGASGLRLSFDSRQGRVATIQLGVQVS